MDVFRSSLIPFIQLCFLPNVLYANSFIIHFMLSVWHLTFFFLHTTHSFKVLFPISPPDLVYTS